MTSETMQIQGGFLGDPAEAFNPPSSNGCCGSPVRVRGPEAAGASTCCGTAAEAKAESSCCGSAAKEQAVSAGAGCCG